MLHKNTDTGTEQELDEILDDTLNDFESQEKQGSEKDVVDLDAVLNEVTSEYSKKHTPTQKSIELDDEDLDCSVLPKDSNTQSRFQSHANRFLPAMMNSPGMAAMYEDKHLMSTMANYAEMIMPMFTNNPQMIEFMNTFHARHCKEPNCKYDAAAFLKDPNIKNNMIGFIENTPDLHIDELIAEEFDNLAPIIIAPMIENPENLTAFFNHPNSDNFTANFFNNPNVTEAMVETLSAPEYQLPARDTKNPEQDSEQDKKLKETMTNICHDHPELQNAGINIGSSVNLNVAIKALLAVTNINEQEDSDYTKLLKAAGNMVGVAAQEAKNLSIEDKQKLLVYVTETRKLIENPKSDLNQYSTYITQAIGMNSNTGKRIALAMLVVAGVVLLLAAIALGAGLAAASFGASIPFSALVIAGLGGTLTAGITTAVGGVAGLSFATFGGVFAERARKGDIHLAMDNFSKVRRPN